MPVKAYQNGPLEKCPPVTIPTAMQCQLHKFAVYTTFIKTNTMFGQGPVLFAVLIGWLSIWVMKRSWQLGLTPVKARCCSTRVIQYGNVNSLIAGFLAATKQLYEWSFPSVCLSVCLSVCHTFLTMFPSSYHHEIFRSYYQWQMWRPCKRSRSEVKGQGHRGQHPT